MLLELENNKLPTLLREGNKSGYDILYKKYAATLYGMISRLVPDAAIADLLLEKTILCIVREINTYDENKTGFFTWMSRIARRMCNERMAPSKKAAVKHPENCPEVVKLMFWNGYSANETARMMNISVSEVKVCLREALKTMKNPPAA